jgi:hypothetical protein
MAVVFGFVSFTKTVLVSVAELGYSTIPSNIMGAVLSAGRTGAVAREMPFLFSCAHPLSVCTKRSGARHAAYPDWLILIRSLLSSINVLSKS